MPRTSTKAKAPAKGKAAAKGKAKKDPNEPKRPRSAWIYYSVNERPKLKEKYPDLKMTEITKKLSSKWKEMTDDDKEPWNEKAAEDKERYATEKAEWEKKKNDVSSESYYSSEEES
eukprot:TRINITY_DN10935_c0_g1_i1.p1 TRINITY_DN10935_c0_g1~~TRINITY_DN10935_c0_g1_i1.p1  ORF type:complete len:116 (+),score=41.33 TRINITY_DN10935_c0_g1_i1:186-533(+)